jgi:hypothetical protein
MCIAQVERASQRCRCRHVRPGCEERAESGNSKLLKGESREERRNEGAHRTSTERQRRSGTGANPSSASEYAGRSPRFSRAAPRPVGGPSGCPKTRGDIPIGMSPHRLPLLAPLSYRDYLGGGLGPLCCAGVSGSTCEGSVSTPPGRTSLGAVAKVSLHAVVERPAATAAATMTVRASKSERDMVTSNHVCLRSAWAEGRRPRSGRPTTRTRPPSPPDYRSLAIASRVGSGARSIRCRIAALSAAPSSGESARISARCPKSHTFRGFFCSCAIHAASK